MTEREAMALRGGDVIEVRLWGPAGETWTEARIKGGRRHMVGLHRPIGEPAYIIVWIGCYPHDVELDRVRHIRSRPVRTREDGKSHE